jgi:hypothetical protein
MIKWNWRHRGDWIKGIFSENEICLHRGCKTDDGLTKLVFIIEERNINIDVKFPVLLQYYKITILMKSTKINNIVVIENFVVCAVYMVEQRHARADLCTYFHSLRGEVRDVWCIPYLLSIKDSLYGWYKKTGMHCKRFFLMNHVENTLIECNANRRTSTIIISTPTWYIVDATVFSVTNHVPTISPPQCSVEYSNNRISSLQLQQQKTIYPRKSMITLL